MSEKKQTPEDEQKKDEPTQSNAATAVLERPAKREFQDDDRVTVLHGWGRVHPGEKHFIDKVLFKDGVANDVPYAVAKHWQNNTRPDGKHDQVYGKVHVQILPKDASESDFIKATGGKRMPIEQFAAQLAGVDLDALVAQMGVEKIKAIIDGMEKHLPPAQRRA